MRLEAARVLLEALLVAVLGLCVALVANFFSPRGVSLTRDYFPARDRIALHPDSATSANATLRTEKAPNSRTTPGQPAAGQKPETPTINTAEALQLFRDPQYEQELIVFVDARDDRHYGEGHIPRAYQLDRYYPENHLPTVLPACLNADRVVVYCNGGDCEDSHFAAQALQEAGVPAERLTVYAGGMTEWNAQHLPVETGERNSGNLRTRKP